METREEEMKALLLELWNCPSENRTEEIVERMDRLSPDPAWSDHLFHSDEFVGEQENLDVDGLLKRILEYKPIEL